MGPTKRAIITQARKQATRLECRRELLQGRSTSTTRTRLNTGIAFLIVCDMLLTGFDAPIEQVMYIDKRLKEHNLLQTIARVNRVAKGKHRGYIVDYIGLTDHLNEALSIYAADDAEGRRRTASRTSLANCPCWRTAIGGCCNSSRTRAWRDRGLRSKRSWPASDAEKWPWWTQAVRC